MGKLDSKTIAILTESGFEEVELSSPKKELEKEGATVHIVSPANKLMSWDSTDWGREYPIDKNLDDANPGDYDAIFLPGGVLNPDKLRTSKKAVKFVQAFFDANKLVASICHGPQTLIETGEVKGRKLTSYPSVATDLKNAGGMWEDSEVVVDQGLVTSRNPGDLDAFNNRVISELQEVPATV